MSLRLIAATNVVLIFVRYAVFGELWGIAEALYYTVHVAGVTQVLQAGQAATLKA